MGWKSKKKKICKKKYYKQQAKHKSNKKRRVHVIKTKHQAKKVLNSVHGALLASCYFYGIFFTQWSFLFGVMCFYFLLLFIFSSFFELQHIDSQMNNEQVHSFSLKGDRRRCNYFLCSKFLEIYFFCQKTKQFSFDKYSLNITYYTHLNKYVEIDTKNYFGSNTKKNDCNKRFERTQREVLFKKQCVR